ncbi:MAG: hypothetical protein JO366_16585 [Methylobacteriaceae bacterium]|nr:hypothetical protein [Methylobacteriaceae bacterium]MBV9246417.1 hypothetical protein [Methylobacteriaceae bacterium]MBV9703955.1 hypothetical protein [Methylobacteriaceae bacterium]
MPEVISSEKAKQGRSGVRIFLVLAAGVAFATLAFIWAMFWPSGTP